MRIAMISEHASPLAALGGEDAGGQNAHVAELSAALAQQGHQVRQTRLRQRHCHIHGYSTLPNTALTTGNCHNIFYPSNAGAIG